MTDEERTGREESEGQEPEGEDTEGQGRAAEGDDEEAQGGSAADDDAGKESEGETPDDDDELFDKQRARSLVKKLRDEVKDKEKSEKALQRKLDKYEQANKTREEKLQDQLKAKDEEIRELKDTVANKTTAAQRRNFIEQMGYSDKTARTAFALLGTEIKVEPEYDDDDMLVNEKQVRAALRKYDSNLFGEKGSDDAGKRDRDGSGPPPSMNNWIRSQARARA